MPMSKKHYEADAAAISTILWQEDSDPLTISRVIAALADVRANDNPRFDKQRFIVACTNNPSTR